jgi:hypothetical protein
MLTRRDFMAELAATAAAMGAMALAGAKTVAGMPRLQAAVVSIHRDQPYLDASGRELPYWPPAGVRAGTAVAHLSETELRRRFPYL